VNEIILYVGLGILIVGGIGLLISAFRTGIFWGLAVLFIAPVALIYLIVHWQDAKGPFKLQVVGILIIAVAAYMNGGMELPASARSGMATMHSFTSGNSGLSSPSMPSITRTRSPKFACDGRQYCSQMHSRAEAEFFIRNCPNTKMDGDRDGVPCENDSRF